MIGKVLCDIREVLSGHEEGANLTGTSLLHGK